MSNFDDVTMVKQEQNNLMLEIAKYNVIDDRAITQLVILLTIKRREN